MLSYIYWNQSADLSHTITSITSTSASIYTGSQTGEICFWKNLKPFLFCSSSQVSCLFLCTCASPNTYLLSSKILLISLHKDSKLRTWDSEDGRCLNSQKLGENFEPEGITSSGVRICVVWTKTSIVIIDAWTLIQLKNLKPGGQIFDLSVINNSKIVMVNSKSELKFWDFEETDVQETPFFVYKTREGCIGVCIGNCGLICLRFKEFVEFWKISDIKHDSHDVCIMRTCEISLCSFAGDYFYYVCAAGLYRILTNYIVEELTPCTFLKLVKELDSPSDRFEIDPKSKYYFSQAALISFHQSTLTIYPLDSFTNPIVSVFSITTDSNFSEICANEQTTYSSLILNKYPTLLIGTSSGKLILQPLNPDETPSIHTLHTSPITCISICKNTMLSCSSDSVLCISKSSKAVSYCQLLSPAVKIIEVSCIQDTIHNISDSFWKNSWKNWDETVLIHCQDHSVALVSLYTNSIICAFSTMIPQVDEAQVHVLLEYLLIRSEEYVYVFNMMMQCLERVATGVSASELLRKENNLRMDLSSKSSEDVVSEPHRVIERNCKPLKTSRKGISTGSVNMQGLNTPIITIGDFIEPEHMITALSILTCWKDECSSHESLAKLHSEMKKPIIQGLVGLKGEDWQSYHISPNSKYSKHTNSLITLSLMQLSSLGCTFIKPSIAVLAMKSITGCHAGQKVLKDIAVIMSPSHKAKIVNACIDIIKSRTPTSEIVKKTVNIVGSLPRTEIESEWSRTKNTLAECHSCIILSYFSSEIDPYTLLLVITSIFSLLRSNNPSLVTSASKAIIHTIPLWKSLISARLKVFVKELIAISINSLVPIRFYKAIGAMTASEIKTYLELVSEEVTNPDLLMRKAWLKSLKWMVCNKYEQLALFLVPLLEVILKTLSPHTPVIRKSCIEQTSEILQILMVKLPMVAFSQVKQRIAIGNTDNSITIYDLKTASLWKALEGHEAPVSAVVFSQNGDTVVSYSAQDFTLRVWKIEVSFFQGLVGSKNLKPSNVVPLPQVKRTVCNFKDFLDCISLQWKSDALKLIREDTRVYSFSI